MKSSRLLAIVPLIAVPLLGQPAPFNPLAFTTGPFGGCPPQGQGGDPYLNALKNRDRLPPEVPAPLLTVHEILSFRPAAIVAMGKRDRRRWSPIAFQQVTAWEASAAVVQGYLIGVKRGGGETCNCLEGQNPPDAQEDVHLLVSEDPTDPPSRSVVMEVTPRLKRVHPNWRYAVLLALARQRVRIRIGGWLMWDQEHPPEVGRTRGTLWEIHPIHRIQVYTGQAWQDL